MTDQTNAATNAAKEAVVLERRYFKVDEIEQGVEYYNAVVEANPTLPVASNFSIEDGEIPEGMALVVLPVNSRTEGKEGREVTTDKIMLAIVPDVNAILNGTAGEAALDYATDTLVTAFMDKLVSSDKSKSILTLPATIADFITVRSRNSELSAYNAVASDLLKALKGKGFKTLTQGLLRSCLESAAFAEHQYEVVPQAFWLQVLEIGAAFATKANKDTAIFTHWKETRDQNAVETGKLDLDLSGLI